MDGGRTKWVMEGRPVSMVEPAPELTTYRASAPDPSLRAMKEYVVESLDRTGVTLLDTRTVEEYAGQLTSAPGTPQPDIYRKGRIPGAVHVAWDDGAAQDGAFKPVDELRAMYSEAGIEASDEVIPYCRLGCGRRTAGSSSSTFSDSTTCASTTGRGRSGATRRAYRSRRTSRSDSAEQQGEARMRQCGVCGTEGAEDARFCPTCGGEMRPVAGVDDGGEEDVTESDDRIGFCTECGAVLAAGNRFCGACGAGVWAGARATPPRGQSFLDDAVTMSTLCHLSAFASASSSHSATSSAHL